MWLPNRARGSQCNSPDSLTERFHCAFVGTQVQAPDNLWEEADVLLHVRKWRWISCKIGSYQFLAMNWVVTFLASAILLTFVILGALEETSSDLARIFYTEGQSWVTQNFTWLYILTQDVWVIFLIYLACTKYGDLKLGKDNELPRYNNLTWFCMIFCCGIAVGFFLFGVGEPLYYYRQPTYWKRCVLTIGSTHDRLVCKLNALTACGPAYDRWCERAAGITTTACARLL